MIEIAGRKGEGQGGASGVPREVLGG